METEHNQNIDTWNVIISNLVNDKKLSDSKFVIQNSNTIKEYYCHTLIVSLMGSEYLKTLIKNNNNVVTLQNISHLAFEYILEYMYKSVKFGGIKINEQNLGEIWFAGHSLNLNKIKQQCVNYICNMMNDINTFVAIILNLQNTLTSEHILQLLGHKMIITNVTEHFWDDGRLIDINPQILQLFLKSDDGNLSEDKKWHYCKQLSQNIAFSMNEKNTTTDVKWQQIMIQFANCIKFARVNNKLFVNEIRNSGVLSIEKIFQIYDCKLGVIEMNPM